MTIQPELHTPTEEELQMLGGLASGLKELGDFQIRSVVVLFDEPATLLVSVKAPPVFETAGTQMTALHTLAQDISDEYSRNLVITTTNFSEGGRKVSFNPDDFQKPMNVVALNPNKRDRALVSADTRRAAASPGQGNTFAGLIISLDAACSEAEQYITKGYREESEKLLEKLSLAASRLKEATKVSLENDAFRDLCLQILYLYVEHNRIDGAKAFLETIAAGTPSSITKELRKYLDIRIQNKQDAKLEASRETQTMLAHLETLLKDLM